MGHYRAVLEEILECLHESRLYDETESLELAVLGSPEDRLVVEQMIRPFEKIRVAYASNDIKEYEFPALELIENACRTGNTLVYYLHTKGVSQREHNQHERYWRALMLHHVVERHAECLEALATHAAAGANWQGNHFSGNFWWATSRHIRSLPSIRLLRRSPKRITRDPAWNLRLQCEFWIGMTRAPVKNFTPSSPVNLYENILWHRSAADVLRWLLTAQAGTRYLALAGTGTASVSIGAPLEHVVSLSPTATFRMDENEFLSSALGEPNYDLVFIDSPRNVESAFNVIEALLPRVAPNGALVVRHTNPPTALHARTEGKAFGEDACGEAWHGIVRFRLAHPTMSVVTVDTDWGCTVIRPWAPATPMLHEESVGRPSYEGLAANRAAWLNLVSPRRFRRSLDFVPRRLGHTPIDSRTAIINSLVSRNGLERYLQLGVSDPKSDFARVIAPIRQSVDPIARATYCTTSDDFFARRLGCETYDLVFVDGFHEEGQCLRDIENSLTRLSPHGFIVVHDANPPTEWHQRPAAAYRPGTDWNGTVWKAIVRFRAGHPECEVVTVDVDWGCAVIRRSPSPTDRRFTAPAELAWSEFDAHRREWIDLISVDEFRDRYLR